MTGDGPEKLVGQSLALIFAPEELLACASSPSKEAGRLDVTETIVRPCNLVVHHVQWF